MWDVVNAIIEVYGRRWERSASTPNEASQSSSTRTSSWMQDLTQTLSRVRWVSGLALLGGAVYAALGASWWNRTPVLAAAVVVLGLGAIASALAGAVTAGRVSAEARATFGSGTDRDALDAEARLDRAGQLGVAAVMALSLGLILLWLA